MDLSDSEGFSLAEIKAQLAALGYDNVGDDRLGQFQSDLSRLMSGGDSDVTPMMNLNLQSTGDSFLDVTDATEYLDLPRIVGGDAIDSDSNSSIITSSSNSTVPEPVFRNIPPSKMKRKVLRHRDGNSFVSVVESVKPNESIVSIERDNFDTDSLMSFSTIDSELRGRLDRLKINIRGEETVRPQTAIKKVSRVRFDENQAPLEPSVRPRTAPPAACEYEYWDGEKGSTAQAFLRPHFKTGRKDGPVELFQKYRNDWGRFQYPTGEWNKERQAVRRLMAQRDPEPVLPRRKIKTDYVVPTSKKRRALAWEVRSALHERRPIPN